MEALGFQVPIGEDGTLTFGTAADWGITDLFDGLDYETRTYSLFARYAIDLGSDDESG